MTGDIFKQLQPREPEQPPNWEAVMAKHADLTGMRPALEGAEAPSEADAPLVSVLNEYADNYAATPEARADLATVFPDMSPATVAYYLYISDTSAVLTHEMAPEYPQYISRVLANPTAMRMLGGTMLRSLRHYDPEATFVGTDDQLQSAGRMTMLGDILLSDNVRTAPIVADAAKKYPDDLAIATLKPYAYPKSSLITYEKSKLLRHGIFADASTEHTVRGALATAPHPFYPNVKPGSEIGAAILEQKQQDFEVQRNIVIQELSQYSVYLAEN